MAGDWIKLEVTTPDKPEVYAIADHLKVGRDAALGMLVRLFVWYDQHLTNGNAVSVSDVTLCTLVGNGEFAQALRKVGWLRDESGALLIPNFERHNGKPAKQRALIGRRVANFRNRDVTPDALAREEKRRVKNKSKASAFALPDWVPLEAWQGYVEMRGKSRKALTDRAKHLAVAKLADLKARGHAPLAVLEQSTFNGWAGLFELKEAGAVSTASRIVRTCDYCPRVHTGSVGGIYHCDEHMQDAMERKPRQ